MGLYFKFHDSMRARIREGAHNLGGALYRGKTVCALSQLTSSILLLLDTPITWKWSSLREDEAVLLKL